MVYTQFYLITGEIQRRMTKIFASKLGPSINGLVTNRNTNLCCRAFILALFHSTTANKTYSEHTLDYKKLFPVCKVEILQATVKKLKFSHLWGDF